MTHIVKNSAIALALVLAGSLMLQGCADGAKALKDSQAAYNAGNYSDSYESAKAVANDTGQTTPIRQQAAYFAGSSAMKLGKNQEAADFFSQAAESADPGLSSDALAMLGGAYAASGQYDLAATQYLKASEKMTGENKAKVLFYAGIAQQKMGHIPKANINLTLARSLSSDPEFKKRVDEQLQVTGFTIQTGAFSTEAAAKQEAAIVSAKATPLKFFTRVVPAVDSSGKKIYLVQVGNFNSQPTAMQGIESMKLTNAFVTPLRDFK